MLARGTGVLTDTRAEHRAVPAFTTYTLESTRAICQAAQKTGLPAIISAGSSSFRGVGRELLAAAALAAARAASVPVGVHLDHSTRPDEIAACIALGYSSVMIDGSHLPFEANVAITRAVVEQAHRAGVWVEAELAGVAGEEDASSDAVAGELTAAVAGGIAKVNINAELRRGYLAALSGALNGGDDIPRLQDAAVAAMTDIAAEKLTLLAGQEGCR
jgi:fructose/tagatose bisphosphate aldolase